MNQLFLNDFIKCKYEAGIRAMQEEDERDHGKRRKALEECATEVERAQFISKKAFYLRYKQHYGASHQEAQDLFFF